MVELRGSRKRRGSFGDAARMMIYGNRRGWSRWLGCLAFPCLALSLACFVTRAVWSRGADSARSPSVRGGDVGGVAVDKAVVKVGADPDAPVVAFAVSVTRLDFPGAWSMVDAAEVLVRSIRRACTLSSYRCEPIAFVLPSVSEEGRGLLREMGWNVMERDLPVAVADIENKMYREHVVKSGCCGADEFLKLHAYTLTDYHRVLHLDIDTLLLHPLDELMESEASLLFTTDVAMAMDDAFIPVQGGFLLVKPDLEVYDKLCAIVRKGDWRKGDGWGGSKIGWFYGGATIQGLLPYFYDTFTPPGTSIAVDRCAYNHMSDTDVCRSSRYTVEETLTDVDLGADNESDAVIPIKSVHFTQSCLKPWMCSAAKPKHGPCRALQRAWLEERGAVFMDRGLPFTEACTNQVYSPIPRT